MRKLFLFIFILLPSLIFADFQTSTVVVKTTVKTITLSEASSNGDLSLYKLYGGFETNASADTLLVDDISNNDVVVFFRVAQLARTRTDETIQLEVSAAKLINTSAEEIHLKDPEALTETDLPTISEISCFSENALQVSSIANASNEVQFILRYIGCSPIENIDIAYFKSTWNKTSGLASGLYTSAITLSYITN